MSSQRWPRDFPGDHETNRKRRSSEGHTSRRHTYSDNEGKLQNSASTPRSPPNSSEKRNEFIDPVVDRNGTTEQISRKRSLVRPERSRIDRDHPNYHYRQRAANVPVQPSTTGTDPLVDDLPEAETASSESTEVKAKGHFDHSNDVQTTYRLSYQRRRSSGFTEKEGTIQRERSLKRQKIREKEKEQTRRQRELEAARVPTLWLTYCHLVTFWCPDAILRCFGKPAKAQQRAWREKMGLISIILLVCLFVGFLTFGFTITVCPEGGGARLRVNHVDQGYLIIHGQAYDLSRSEHPAAVGVPAGANVVYDLGYGGKDASFMFQNVNGNCKGLITAAPNSDVPTNPEGDLGWYFPCNAYNQDGSSNDSPNQTVPYYLGYACHLSSQARDSYYGLHSSSAVYYTWSDVKNNSRNLAVWGSDVLDLDLLKWFNTTQVSYPVRFDEIRENPAVKGSDITLSFSGKEDQQIARCFSEIIRVGTIDTETIGCIASKVVLYVSLVFILSIVFARFTLAVLFQWFLCHKYAVSGTPTGESARIRKQQIEDWADDIYRPPPKLQEPADHPNSERSRRSTAFLPTTSRFTSPYAMEKNLARSRPEPTTMASQSSTARPLPSQLSHQPIEFQSGRGSTMPSERAEGPGPAGFIHEAVVPQPPLDWQPFGCPLAHTICLVTAYSEGPEGMRTTMDSIAITDYPNSHKLILVICDGLVKGKGEEMTTPDVVLGMMKDFVVPPEEVQPFSYVAVASGSKRHNMAKIFAGFYDYGNESLVPHEQQQRVPMLAVVKCGTPDEAKKAKPGNRGKRDSQIILMSFLQKVMFNERMTELEFEMFNGIWKITGISPDYYEIVLMVDADTKVYPDCLTYMVSAMVKDPDIMGLCGETKITNKRESWVTMIQVFEYFISHHQAKSFESVFGGVTCLPGCFSSYRIKSPKGSQNYWVPILANPDIVEHYSENVVDTLHKKNLLLLGEDRYLSSLMLKTFPKRKQVFVPQAVCKTTVPNTFRVLLSQRRRWINSTIHNLMELVLVRDLCGTFCFSMQFVVFIDLIGTLVLPAAISFTVYLIVRAIVDAVTHQPIPTIPLVLLALILGLPAILIVITAKQWSYVAWMFIYLLSLPIWNGVLPAYAYWKFDDFSWGDTRKLAGEKTKKAGLEYEGEFDSTKITMKRWRDFEQERRLRVANDAWARQSITPSMGVSRPGSYANLVGKVPDYQQGPGHDYA